MAEITTKQNSTPQHQPQNKAGVKLNRNITSRCSTRIMSYWDEKNADEEKDSFEETCNNVARHVTAKGALNILVCVDGSDNADAAFRSALNIRRKFDHIEIFHAYKDIPDLQPATWRYNQLKSKYEVELISKLPSSLYSLSFIDRVGEPTNKVLHQCVDPEHFAKDADEPSPLYSRPDLIVVGRHGRKGCKDRRYAIGSTADHALRQLHYPCLVVRDPLPSGARSFIMAVNDSPRSKRGLDILLRFTNPRDTVLLMHFTTTLKYNRTLADQKNAMKDYYEHELQEVAPVNSRFEFVEIEHGADLANAVVQYVNDSSADVFAIAPRAIRDRSSITEDIMKNVLTSVLLCKN